MASFATSSPEDALVERPALEWLERYGWQVAHGPDLAPDGDAPERGHWQDVVLVDRLRGAVAELNPKLPVDAVDRVVNLVLTAASPNPIEDHADFHRLLVDGVQVSYLDQDNVERATRAKLVDFDDVEANDFLAVNQFTVIVGQKNRRPDILLFVNGLPLGQLELKSPTSGSIAVGISDEAAAGEEVGDIDGVELESPEAEAFDQAAVHQVRHYVETVPPLYRHVEIVGVSDLLRARMGTITTPPEHFSEWKSMDPSEDEGLSQLEVMIRGAFAPAAFLDLVRNFVLFESDGAKTAKILAKYHQVDAVHKAIESTAEAMGGDGRAGVVWHTQGAGKSYTMVFYTQMLRRDPRFSNPTIVAVTDRIDLDDQLMQTFAKQAELAQAVKQADSVEELHSMLKTPAGGIYFTVINKFQPPEGKKVMPVLSERENVIVMSDEAHRSQYASFAANLREALPNATRIGFTGTPIETDSRSTRLTFGDYISIYDIGRAVEDGATVRIYYENRAIPLDIADADLVEETERLLEEEDEQAAGALIQRESKLERVVGADDRLDRLAADIAEHFSERQEALEGKGMVIGMSRRVCVALADRLKEKLGDDAVTCVITAAAHEENLNRYRRSKQEMEQVAKYFKDPEHPLKLVVVRDMWLTGFDVPPLHTLYIDKPMRDHGLLQAIARVNRVFRDKPGGLVVDYIGIGEDLRKALPGYSTDEVEEAMVPLKKVISALRERHDVVSEFFHGLDWTDRETMSAGQRATLLVNAHARVVADEGDTKRFLREQAAFAKLFALVNPDPAARALLDDAAFFAVVAKSVRKYTPPEGEVSAEARQAVRQVFSEGLAAGEVVDIFGLSGEERPEISVLSDEFLDSLDERISQPDLQVALLRKLLRGEVRARGAANQMQAKLFGERLDDALARYANRQLTSAEVVQALVALAKDMREARRRHEKLGLSREEAAFYDALSGNPDDLKADPEIAKIAKELVKSIRADLSVDWTQRESREAAIRRKIKRLLRKHKFKPPRAAGGRRKTGRPFSLEETTDLILGQARAIYRRWPDLSDEEILS